MLVANDILNFGAIKLSQKEGPLSSLYDHLADRENGTCRCFGWNSWVRTHDRLVLSRMF